MKSILAITLLLISSLLIHGCATSQNQGKLVRAGEVSQLVESATVLQDHTYYYTGPEAEPDAIIAINNRITVQSKYWIKVDDPDIKLADWNRFIDNDHRVPGEHDGIRVSYRYEGARIMNPDGQQVGIWYSRHDYTVIQFPDPTTIIIYTPVEPVGGDMRFPSR